MYEFNTVIFILVQLIIQLRMLFLTGDNVTKYSRCIN